MATNWRIIRETGSLVGKFSKLFFTIAAPIGRQPPNINRLTAYKTFKCVLSLTQWQFELDERLMTSTQAGSSRRQGHLFYLTPVQGKLSDGRSEKK
jgi:hypothetical protein